MIWKCPLSENVTDPSIVCRRLKTFPVKLVGSKKLVDKLGKPTHPSRLNKFPCIGFNNEEPWVFSQDSQACQVRPKLQLQTNDLLYMLDAAKRGLGAVVLPEFVCRKGLTKGKLLELLPQWQPRVQTCYMLYPARQHLSPVLKTFLDFVFERGLD